MKLGVFSGTFDPVHSGHVGFAESARKLIDLDKVIFMPETSPRRKENVSDISHRTQMLELALRNYDWAEVFISQSEKHSVNATLIELKKEYGEQCELFLLMGVDVYENLRHWDSYQKLIEEVQIVLALRTEDDGELAIDIANELEDEPTMIVSNQPGLSSSIIRGGNHSGIDSKVAEYIEVNELYV